MYFYKVVRRRYYLPMFFVLLVCSCIISLRPSFFSIIHIPFLYISFRPSLFHLSSCITLVSPSIRLIFRSDVDIPMLWCSSSSLLSANVFVSLVRFLHYIFTSIFFLHCPYGTTLTSIRVLPYQYSINLMLNTLFIRLALIKM